MKSEALLIYGHDRIELSIALGRPATSGRNSISRDWAHYISDLNHNLRNFSSADDMGDMIAFVNNSITYSLSIFAPIRRTVVTQCLKLWVTAEIRSAMKEREAAYKKARVINLPHWAAHYRFLLCVLNTNGSKLERPMEGTAQARYNVNGHHISFRTLLPQ